MSINNLTQLKRFEDTCLGLIQPTAPRLNNGDNINISDFRINEEIDCAPAITPQNDNDCKDNNCKGMKNVDNINKCYSINYIDVFRQFGERYFSDLKDKNVLPIPDRGACLFLSIIESIYRDNDFKILPGFNNNRILDTATSPKVPPNYLFNNNYLEEEALKLRNCAVDFVIKNWDKIPLFGISFEDIVDMQKDIYSAPYDPNNKELNKRSMRHPTTYADIAEIIAISTLLNININIFNVSQDNTNITYNRFEPIPTLSNNMICTQYNRINIDIYLGYINNNHYFCFVKNKNN